MKWFWSLINEKKTTIGAGLFLAAMILQKMSDIWMAGDAPDWTPKLIESLQWFGCVFSGVGLSHKGVKAVKKN